MVRDIIGFHILILDGVAEGQVGAITSLSEDGRTAFLEIPFEIAPQSGDAYFFFPKNPNEVVLETEQVDTLSIFHRASVADGVGVLTENRLTGFGMGPDLVIAGRALSGGISYNEVEVLNLYLGIGDDRLAIESTHIGRTVVYTGAGADVVDVLTIAGHTEIHTGEQIDLVNIGSGVGGQPLPVSTMVLAVGDPTAPLPLPLDVVSNDVLEIQEVGAPSSLREGVDFTVDRILDTILFHAEAAIEADDTVRVTLLRGDGSGGLRLLDEIAALLVVNTGDDQFTGALTDVDEVAGTVLTDFNVRWPTALPIDPTLNDLDLKRLRVDIITQADLGGLELLVDEVAGTAILRFTPTATFDDFDVFAARYRLYTTAGDGASYQVAIDAAALDFDGDRFNSFDIDLLDDRALYLVDLTGLAIEVETASGAFVGTIVSNTGNTVTVDWQSAMPDLPVSGDSYRIFGLEGFGDRVNADDSGDPDANLATLTQTTLVGLDMPTASEVQSILVRADRGVFVVGSPDLAGETIVLDVTASVQVLQAVIAEAYVASGAIDIAEVPGIRVSRAGGTLTIVFGGPHAGRDFATLEWLRDDGRNSLAVTDADTTVNVTITPLRDGSNTPALSTVRTVTVDPADGAFGLAIDDVAAFNLEVQTIIVPAGTAAFSLTVARMVPNTLTDIETTTFTFDPTKSDRELAGDLREAIGSNAIELTRIGEVYTIVWAGPYLGLDLPELTVENGLAIATITDGGSPLNFAPDASAEEILAALQLIADPSNTDPDLPHTRNVAVTKIGHVYIIYFQGARVGTDARPTVELLVGGTAKPEAVATRLDGINYYNVETLNIDLGSGDDVINVQGTTARTNLRLHDGDERIYVSSAADLDIETAADPVDRFDFLPGHLDDVDGMLNIRAGAGRHLLMISDEAAAASDADVLITDDSAKARGKDPAVPDGFVDPVGIYGRYNSFDPDDFASYAPFDGTSWDPFDLTAYDPFDAERPDTEIYIIGLAQGAITFSASSAAIGTTVYDPNDPATYHGPAGNFADGISIWTGAGDDVIEIDGTHVRDAFDVNGDRIRTGTRLNTGYGDDTLTVALDAVAEVQTITVESFDPTSGTVTVAIPDRLDEFGAAKLVPIQLADPIGQTQNDLRLAYGSDDLQVTRDVVGNTVRYTLTFADRLAGHNFVTVEVAATDGVNSVAVATEIQGTPEDGFSVINTEPTAAAATPAPIAAALFAGLAALDVPIPFPGNTLDASASTLPQVIFGGIGRDYIIGGQAADIIFGDLGKVLYFDAPLPDDLPPLTLDNLAALEALAVTVLGGSELILDGDFGNPLLILTIDPGVGDADIIDGNLGNDIIFGGNEADQIDGGGGGDIIIGDHGRATLTGSLVTLIETTHEPLGAGDRLFGSGESDIILGGAGRDYIEGNGEKDLILGDNGIVLLDDRTDWALDDQDANLVERVGVVQTTDPDKGGNDTVYGNAADDIIIGGGNDDQPGDPSRENLHGGAADDIIIGDYGRIQFADGLAVRVETDTANPAAGGDDEIEGNDGFDIVLGGVGNDHIDGGTGAFEIGDADDILVGDDGYVLLWDAAADDFDATRTLTTYRVYFITVTDNLIGGVDTITGGNAEDIVIGGANSDVLDGNEDDDLVVGDNAVLDREMRVGDFTGLRFQVLDDLDGDGQLTLYDAADNAQNDGIARLSPDNSPVWADYLLVLLDHGFDDEAAGRNNFGDDYIAGGPHDDRIFGQLGNDVIQGDGSIESALRLDLTSGAIGFGQTLELPGSELIPLVGGLVDGDDDTITLADHGLTDGTTVVYRVVSGGAAIDGLQANEAYDVTVIDADRFAIKLVVVTDIEALVAPAGASRAPQAELVLTPSFEDPSDGDDYIEGNGGNDVIFGNLGQDDIIGGSTDRFGLVGESQRPDGTDIIFGGAGTAIARNDYGAAALSTDGTQIITAVGGHARDADVILGDNGLITRILQSTVNGATAYETFHYDDYAGGLRIIPRVISLLDYLPGGPDVTATTDDDVDPALAAGDIGAPDEIHGEAGDDLVHGMAGNDVIFGEGQDDDLIGGYGNDWISGGTGIDGVLGDDGRIYTSRNNGTDAEPLYGIESIAALDETIDTPGNIQQAVIHPTGALKKTVNLTPFYAEPETGISDPLFDPLFADDIVYGGLGGDFLHGGPGDDLISGAEALAAAYFEHFAAYATPDETRVGVVTRSDYTVPFNPGNVLGFEARKAEEFAAYDEFNPRTRIQLDIGAAEFGEFLGNFATADLGDQFDAPLVGQLEDGTPVYGDGADRIFGDLGNDWLVGGTDNDHIYGGWGNDLLNADDDHDTTARTGSADGPLANNEPDTHPTYEDIAYGGAGRDVLIGNTGGDRMIDWTGEFNSFLVPFAPFGAFAISRALMPGLFEYLYDLSASDGADPTRAADTAAGSQIAIDRNGEPEGELGLITQQDVAWQDQTGAPDDVQPGNIGGGKRDVLRGADFNGTTGAGDAEGFAADSGRWTVEGGRYEVAPETLGGDAASVYFVNHYLPTYFEMRAVINAGKPTAGLKSNAYLIFDYQNAADFKFAGINISIDKMQMGHRTAEGWIIDEQAPARLKPNKDYSLLLALNGTVATLVVSNAEVFSHVYEARVDSYGVSHGLNGGMVGIGANNSVARIDNVAVQVLPRGITLDETETFDDGVAQRFTGNETGDWNIVDGRYEGAPTPNDDIAIATVDVRVQAAYLVRVGTTLRTSAMAGVVFDKYGTESFKFAAISVSTNQLVIGHHTARAGWQIDAVDALSLEAGHDYNLEVTLSGTTISAALDDQAMLGHVFNAVTVDGAFGLFATGAGGAFDRFTLQTDDPAYAGQQAETASPAEDNVAEPDDDPPAPPEVVANGAPVAVDDAISTVEGTALVIGGDLLLANDFDDDGDNLTIAEFGQPANGTLADNLDGSFTYTPNFGFIGLDEFIYRVSDGSVISDPATVRIDVTFEPVKTYATTAAVAIPDRGMIASRIDVVDPFTVVDLNVRLDISHTRDADLRVVLVSPTGIRIELFDGVGGRGDDFRGTTLNDEAGTAIGDGSAPFAGVYRPVGSLGLLDGQAIGGTWTLEVHDQAKRQSGTLNGWSLIVQRAAALLAGAPDSPPVGVAADLTEPQLRPIIDQAILRWLDGGLIDSAQAAGLADVTFVITDLPERMLGAAMADTILIDIDGAGFGWFVDPTPGDDVEFVAGTGRALIATDGLAAGQTDLLTVVMHELGHVLGYDHGDTNGSAAMHEILDAGTRHTDNRAQVDPAIDWVSDELSGAREPARPNLEVVDVSRAGVAAMADPDVLRDPARDHAVVAAPRHDVAAPRVGRVGFVAISPGDDSGQAAKTATINYAADSKPDRLRTAVPDAGNVPILTSIERAPAGQPPAAMAAADSPDRGAAAGTYSVLASAWKAIPSDRQTVPMRRDVTTLKNNRPRRSPQPDAARPPHAACNSWRRTAHG